ncbi:MAG: thioredoxin family protein [Elusimicrobia bacterium]|nr:thioredoxin family protein [Elusimicrobiota bacterium]
MAISIVLFKSNTCFQCKQVEPLFESILKLHTDIKSEVVNIVENLQRAIDNGVMSVPTIVIFKDDKEMKRFTGAVSKEKIEQALTGVL